MSQTEEYVVIGSDRFITVPESLQKIAVQYDHNVNTITFKCPRVWDGRDISEMKLYVNYLRPDNQPNSYAVEADSIVVDAEDNTMFYFDWVVDKFATVANGHLTILVCAKKLGTDGTTEENHWNSELNHDFYISEGLEINQKIPDLYPDVIEKILLDVKTNTDDIKALKEELYGSSGGSGDSEAGALTDRVAALEQDKLESNLNERVTTLEDLHAGVTIIKTVDGTDLRIFVGSKATYEALSETDKEDLFAIITDDDSPEKLTDVIEAVEKIISGETVVPKAADAVNATNAENATTATNATNAVNAVNATNDSSGKNIAEQFESVNERINNSAVTTKYQHEVYIVAEGLTGNFTSVPTTGEVNVKAIFKFVSDKETYSTYADFFSDFVEYASSTLISEVAGIKMGSLLIASGEIYAETGDDTDHYVIAYAMYYRSSTGMSDKIRLDGYRGAPVYVEMDSDTTVTTFSCVSTAI